MSHQPFDLQGEEGGEEEERPYERTDDETQPEYPCLCLCPTAAVPGGLHTHTDTHSNTPGSAAQNGNSVMTVSYFFGLKHPEALSVLVDLIPPAQPHQQPASHILKHGTNVRKSTPVK